MPVQAQVTWSGGAGGGTAWLTTSNWTGGAVPTGLQIAQFGSVGTSTTIGINMNGATNNGVNNQVVGSILLLSSSTISRTINNSASTAAGTLTLNGVGGVLLQNDTTSLGLTITNGSGSATMGLALANSGDIVVTNSAATITINSLISETGGVRSINKTGLGTLILGSGSNSYSGGTTISSGTLQIASGGALGLLPGSPTSNHLVINGGTLAINGTFTLNSNRGITIGASNGAINVLPTRTLTYGGVIEGSGRFSKSGTGSLVLTGSNSFTGGVAVTGGVLSIDSGSGLGQVPGAFTADNLILDGGTLNTTSTFSLNANRGLTLNSGNGVIDVNDTITTTILGAIAGSGSLTKTGTGTLVLSGTNSYGGGTTITTGTLQGTTTSLQGSILNNATLTFNQSASGTYSGNVSGTGSLIKTGSGTVTLSGSNALGGSVSVDQGTLAVTGTLDSDSGVSVASGATLKGTGLVLDTITINSGATIAPGNSPGNLTGSNTTFTAGSIYEFEMNDAGGVAGPTGIQTGWDLLTLLGTLTIDSSVTSSTPVIVKLKSLTTANVAGVADNFTPASNYTWSFITANAVAGVFASDKFQLDDSGFLNSYTGTFSFGMSGNTLNLIYTGGVAAVPEPSSILLASAALAGFLPYYRRRRRLRKQAEVPADRAAI